MKLQSYLSSDRSRNTSVKSFDLLKYWYTSLVRYGKSASDDIAFNDIAFNDIAERPIFARSLNFLSDFLFI